MNSLQTKLNIIMQWFGGMACPFSNWTKLCSKFSLESLLLSKKKKKQS